MSTTQVSKLCSAHFGVLWKHICCCETAAPYLVVCIGSIFCKCCFQIDKVFLNLLVVELFQPPYPSDTERCGNVWTKVVASGLRVKRSKTVASGSPPCCLFKKCFRGPSQSGGHNLEVRHVYLCHYSFHFKSCEDELFLFYLLAILYITKVQSS